MASEASKIRYLSTLYRNDLEKWTLNMVNKWEYIWKKRMSMYANAENWMLLDMNFNIAADELISDY